MYTIRERKKHSSDKLLKVTKYRKVKLEQESENLPFEFFYLLLIIIRLLSSFTNPLSDCDEVYNFWEPVHYLLFGDGFQTWEYSPAYALRSYFYIWLHALPIKLMYSYGEIPKIYLFYFLRIILNLFSSICEIYFCRCVISKQGKFAGCLLLLFLIFSPGMYISSCSFLPSSFSMYFIMLGYSFWIKNIFHWSIFSFGISAIVGWPFTAICGIPLAIDMVIIKKQARLCFIAIFTSLLILLVPLILMDLFYYRKVVLAPLNLVIYNILSDKGPNLYGVEPLSFYLYNLLFNFNCLILFAILSIPFLIIIWISQIIPDMNCLNKLLLMLPLYYWLLIFLLQPHKEERFLYPIFPLICLNAALFFDMLYKTCKKLSFKRKGVKLFSLFNIFVLFSFIIISISRIILIYKGFHAPFDVFSALSKFETSDLKEKNVCIGKEWYRYPSSFFLPTERFIQSDFHGQLPQYYSPLPNGTAIIPVHMNDDNKEEPSRYFNLSQCNFLIDYDNGFNTEREPQFSLSHKWKSVFHVPFLDVSKSPIILRTFYIPFFTDRYCFHGKYHLLKSVSM